MANDNCLAGMACPECKSEGPFHIEIRAIVTVHDCGTGDLECCEWERGSVCGCDACGLSATVDTFTIAAPE